MEETGKREFNRASAEIILFAYFIGNGGAAKA